MCNEDGGIVDDLTVYKFSDEHFMIVTSSAPRKRAVRWIVENAAGASAYPTDITASVALLAVQGPRSRDLLRELVEGVDFDGLRFFRFQAGTIGDVEVLCSRSGYTGELGYELYVPAEEVGPVWDMLLARGREFGLQPYGALAMQSLRIEKALPLYGRDITEELTPFNVGLDRWIRFDKREFIGRDALLRVQEEGIRERFVGLVIDSATPADADDPVMATGDIAAFRALRLSGSEAGEQVEARHAGRGDRLHHGERQGPHGRQDARARLRADDARLPGRAARGARRGPPRAGDRRADAVLRPRRLAHARQGHGSAPARRARHGARRHRRSEDAAPARRSTR